MQNNQSLKEPNQHGTIFFPFAMYECMIPTTYKVLALHWHEEMELGMILEGSCIYQIDLNSYTVNAGDLILLTPHTLHGVSPIDGKTMKSESFVFNLNMLGAVTPDSSTFKYLNPLINREIILPLLIKKEEKGYDELLCCFRQIEQAYKGKDIAYELEIKEGLLRFIRILFQNGFVKGNLKKQEEPALEKVKQIINYMEQHYKDAVTIGELADLCGFSVYHFMRFFKKSVGMTCMEYLNNYRLAATAEELWNTSKPIIDIALENGFNNVSYYNRMFRHRFHMTPKDYRKSRLGS